MALTVAVQMDHISRINIAGDSTFAIMLEGQRRGHHLYHVTPDRLSLRDGTVTAAIEAVTVRDAKGEHFSLGAPERRDLSEMDVVLLRQDPPFDMAYIANTHLLERLQPKTLVVNDPVHVRNAPEKLFVTYFPELMPPTVITRDPGDIRAFRKEHGDIIIKPLNGNGGAGIFRMAAGDQNLNALLEMFAGAYREPYVIQRYIPAVRKGDKRVILVDGVAVGAINRVPSDEETRSNLHVGGRAEPSELTKRDREICEVLGPELKRRGFLFVGIDVIGEYLTEINVTSPTGIRELKRFGGADAAALIWDAIEARR